MNSWSSILVNVSTLKHHQSPTHTDTHPHTHTHTYGLLIVHLHFTVADKYQHITSYTLCKSRRFFQCNKQKRKTAKTREKWVYTQGHHLLQNFSSQIKKTHFKVVCGRGVSTKMETGLGERGRKRQRYRWRGQRDTEIMYLPCIPETNCKVCMQEKSIQNQSVYIYW